MSRTMLIDASHPEETRVAVVDGTRLEELDFESAAKRQIRGNVYLARVTRVEPSLQAAFVEFGGNRHGFLAFSEIHPDYYQIPVEDRKALLEAEQAESLQDEAEEDADAEAVDNGKGDEAKKPAKNKRRKKAVPAKSAKGKSVSEDDDEATDEDNEVSDDEADHDDQSADNNTDDHDKDDDDASDATEKEVAEEQAKQLNKRRKRMSKRRYKIQEVIKRGQILLIQAVKEERGNKGAAVTTYLSLAGRYCVLMPNTPRGGGISRKIANGSDRKRLKSVMSELSVPQGMGLIVRTAGAKRTKTEIKRDYKYLSKLWDNIRKTTLNSIAPSLIHEEANLVKRSIRDLYGKDIDKVYVQGDEAYRLAKDFIKLLMPSHAKNVQPYEDEIPLFLRYQVESQIENCLEPIAQLKSGGYLVIHPTEALVSVDVNSGRSTKERNVERTAFKTNLEAAEEVARQMRLRDLAGLVVIDFIDMEQNRNNRAVEKKMRDALAQDRARVQMGRISQFGLLEMSRQRRRRSLLEGSSASCEHCHGVGRKRSVESSALKALRALEEEGVRSQAKRLRIKVSKDVANYLFNEKRELLNSIETDHGMFSEIIADDDLIRPAFEIEVLERADGKNTDPLDEVAKAHRKEAQARNNSKRNNAKNNNKGNNKSNSDDDSDQDDKPKGNGEGTNDKPSRSKRRRGRRGGRNRRPNNRDNNNNTENGENANTDETKGKAANSETSSVTEGSKDKAPAKQNKSESDDAEKKPTQKRQSRAKKSDQPSDKSEQENSDATKDTAKKKPTRRRKPAAKKDAEKTDTKTGEIADKAPAKKSTAKKTTAKKATKATKVEDKAPEKDAKPKAKPAPRKKAAPKKPEAKPEATTEAASKKKPAPKQETEKPVEKSSEEASEKKSKASKKTGWWQRRK